MPGRRQCGGAERGAPLNARARWDWPSLALALGWIFLYIAVGGGLAYALAHGYTWLGQRDLLPGAVRRTSAWFLPVAGTLPLIAFGFATWLVGARLAGRSWEGLGWRESSPRQLFRGAGVGVGAAVVAVFLTVALGGARVRLIPGGFAHPDVTGPLVLGLLAAALFEELLFRGFPLRALADGIGPWPATLFLGGAFGAAHAWNDHVGVYGILNIALAGVWLSLAFFSGGMGLAWGLHFGWNLGLALLDAPVSGIDLGVPGVSYQWGVHRWLDGGAFGPEGGLVGTIAIALGAVATVGVRVTRSRGWLAA